MSVRLKIKWLMEFVPVTGDKDIGRLNAIYFS
jgi:hypothetical protein